MTWGMIGGAAVSVIGGSLLADDGGAGEANAASADATRIQGQIAKEQWDRYKTVYQPLEDAMVDEAKNADSALNLEKAASEASATVASQYGKARDRLTRTPGLDPSTGAYQAGMIGLDLTQAAADATGQNTARQRTKDTAYAKKVDALSLGKGLPASASNGLATVASQSASQAAAGRANANAQAGAFGRIVDRVTPAVSNWLGNTGNTGSAAPAAGPAPDYSSGANYDWGSNIKL